jgi:hypothetical protein
MIVAGDKFGRLTAVLRLGGYATAEEANEAYFRKAQELFGEFARAA